MTENKKRFRIEFTIDVEERSDDTIKERANMLLSCMIPFPEDITFSEVENPWHTGTPRENGDYLCAFSNGCYGWCIYNDDGWHYFAGYDPSCYQILAWQKIEPYKEKED